MQTFLPYPNFAASACVLDVKRLGKQRVEALQLMRGQWNNHPASRMWRGHEYWLGAYGLFVCEEWINRGYNDTCSEKILAEMDRYVDTGPPPWLGHELFHLSHRSNLLRKDATFYRAHFPDDPDDLPYVWPIGWNKS
jgi:hypothetical protein